jgi:hypothetical protein
VTAKRPGIVKDLHLHFEEQTIRRADEYRHAMGKFQSRREAFEDLIRLGFEAWKEDRRAKRKGGK